MSEEDLRNGARSPDLRQPEKALGEIGTKYVDNLGAQIVKTKAQCLRTLKKMGIAEKPCSQIDAAMLVEHARSLRQGRKPQTVGNYMMHLSAIFSVALIAYKAQLDKGEMRKALKTRRKLNPIKKSGSRNRRPSVEELDRLMRHFETFARRTDATPMHKICGFAIRVGGQNIEALGQDGTL